MTNRSPSAVPPPPGLLNPKVGLFGMLLCLALLLAAYSGIGIFSDEPEDDTPLPSPAPTFERVDEGQLAALLPEDVKRRVERELRAWFADDARRPIRDGEALDEVEWVEHLLTPEVWRPLESLPGRVYGEVDNLLAAYDDPGSQRGQLVSVWGRVVSSTQVELPLTDGPRRAWSVELEDKSGAPWTTTGLDAPPDGVESGAWVKVYGVFTKLWPAASGSRPGLHLFLSRPPVKSFPPVTVEEIPDAWREVVRDEGAAESVIFEEGPFYGFLNYVRNLGPSGYRELRDTDAIVVHDFTDTMGADPLVRDPGKYRFEAVRLQVAPVRKEFAQDENVHENPGNIAFVYRGFVVDHQTRAIQVVSPFPKETFDVDASRMVELEGFFYKRRYVSGSNNKPYWMPVIVMTSMIPMATGEPGLDVQTVIAVGVAGSALLIVLFLFIVYRNRRDQEQFRRRAEERRLRRRGRGSKAAT